MDVLVAPRTAVNPGDLHGPVVLRVRRDQHAAVRSSPRGGGVTALRIFRLVVLAAFATVLALIALDSRPAGEPAPFTPATAGDPVPYLEEP